MRNKYRVCITSTQQQVSFQPKNYDFEKRLRSHSSASHVVTKNSPKKLKAIFDTKPKQTISYDLAKYSPNLIVNSIPMLLHPQKNKKRNFMRKNERQSHTIELAQEELNKTQFLGTERSGHDNLKTVETSRKKPLVNHNLNYLSKQLRKERGNKKELVPTQQETRQSYSIMEGNKSLFRQVFFQKAKTVRRRSSSHNHWRKQFLKALEETNKLFTKRPLSRGP